MINKASIIGLTVALAFSVSGCNDKPMDYTSDVDVTIDYIDTERRKVRIKTVDQLYNGLQIEFYAYACVDLATLDQSKLYKFPLQTHYVSVRNGKYSPRYMLEYNQSIICKYLGSKENENH